MAAVLLSLVGIGFKTAGAGEAPRLAYTEGNLLRLHIIANSDKPSDQALKLKVRDDVLAGTAELFRGVKDAGTARRLVRANLGRFEAIARRRIALEGYAYPVRAEFGRYPFPARAYGDIVLPPGRYQALRLVIGRGAGHNWWCVLFPPLCFLRMDAPLARGRVVRVALPGGIRQPPLKVAANGRRPSPAVKNAPVRVHVLWRLGLASPNELVPLSAVRPGRL